MNDQPFSTQPSVKCQCQQHHKTYPSQVFKMHHYKAILCCAIASSLPFLVLSKPGGEYSTLGGVTDYESSSYGGNYQTVAEPALVKSTATEVLKPSGTFEIGYGAPPPGALLPYYPFDKFGFGGFGGGWKPPQPVFAPIQVIAKPIPIPVATVPFGWGWGNPGLFR